MKTPVYVTLPIGTAVLTIEHSPGESERPEAVTLAVRERREGRRAGARVAVAFGQSRATLLEFGLAILELVDRMPAFRPRDAMPALLHATPEKRALRKSVVDYQDNEAPDPRLVAAGHAVARLYADADQAESQASQQRTAAAAPQPLEVN